MKRYKWLIPISMMVLACDPSTQDPKPDASVGEDMTSDIAQSDIATDTVSSPDVGIDLANDTGRSDIGLDVGLGDIGLNDVGSDTGSNAVCIDGPFGVVDDGQNVTCEWTVTCAGIDYRVDCLNNTCTCTVDGQPSQNTTAETFCSGRSLLDCGATEIPES